MSVTVQKRETENVHYCSKKKKRIKLQNIALRRCITFRYYCHVIAVLQNNSKDAEENFYFLLFTFVQFRSVPLKYPSWSFLDCMPAI